MPWTLYRYILRELLRLLLLASAVLVLLISFAAATKPLSDDLLGPWTLVKFVLFSIPTTLTVVAPFAGAFASTMVFTRMAGDNEIVACATSGMSYRAVLLPVFALGWGLTIVLYLLSNWTVPWFYRQTSLMLQRDVMSLVVSQVRAGRPVRLPGARGYVLYADDAEERVPTADAAEGRIAPQRLIMLRGVAVGVFDSSDRLRDLHSAEKADVYLYRDADRSWVSLRLANVLTYDPDSGTYGAIADTRVLPIPLPNPIADDLRFFSWPQLLQLSRHPQRYDRVERRRRRLAMLMAEQEVVDLIGAALGGAAVGGQAILHGAGGDSFGIRSPRVDRVGSGLELSGDPQAPVRVLQSASGLATASIEGALGVLRVAVDEQEPEPRLELEMESATVRDLRLADRVTEKKKVTIRRLRWPTPLLGPLLEMSPADLTRQVERQFAQSPAVLRAQEQLGTAVVALKHKIFARVHERAALAVASLLVLLLGAVLSMTLSGSLPLVVYFWSFILALAAVLVTRSSENIVANPAYHPAAGLLLVWLGNLVLVAAIAVAYRRLARN